MMVAILEVGIAVTMYKGRVGWWGGGFGGGPDPYAYSMVIRSRCYHIRIGGVPTNGVYCSGVPTKYFQ